MAEQNEKISELTLGTPADTDVIPFVDLATGTTKKATKTDLKGDKGDKGDTGSTGAAGSDGRSFIWKGQWLTATAYAVDDVAYQLGSSYICLTAHTSGTFATDLAASKWQLVVQKGDTGATGPQGIQGVQGVQGDPGATGAAGADGADGAGYYATSASSVVLGTGSKSFTTQAGLAYSPGARARATDAANAAQYLEGIVTSYSGTTLVIESTAFTGSGTISSWNINIAGNVGATGPQGPAGLGTGDVVGPASATDSNFAAFNTTTGKLLKDSTKKASDFVASNGAITGATKTKITYDTKGLVTGGADATQDDIGDGTTNKQYSATDKTKLAGIEAAADVTDAGNVGSSINGATAKVTPVDADTMPLIDSAASNVLKKVTWANIKAALKTYFDTLYELAGAIATHAAVTATHGATGAVVGTTNSQTLTNKRITPRVSTEASSATPTINTDDVDAHSITALAAAITSMTTNLSGTPTNFQKLVIRIKDNGTARGITWGTGFEARGVALPTTTVLSKVLTLGFIYDTVTSKWGCVASAQEA